MAALAFDIPDEITAVCDGISRFIRAEIIPRHDKHHDLLTDPHLLYARDGRYVPRVVELMREVRMAAARAGYYQMCVPEALGGGGLGLLAYFVAWEQIYRQCGMQYWLGAYTLSHWAFGPSVVLREVTDTARQTILADMMAGRTSMCFGLSEPGAGSDAAMIKTRAEPDGNGWRIHGRKIWTTNAPQADWVIVFAVTDPERARRKAGGISAFLVPTDAPGFQVESVIRLFGHAGGNEGQLVFDGVRVEPDQLVGTLHDGFRIGLLGVSLGRIYNTARAVGLGRWALEKALDYAKQREAFGHKIAEYQGVTFPLAESAMELHAAHLMGLNVATLLDRGERAIKELSMAKAYAVEAGFRALDRAMQTHGAMGFTNELHLTHAWHDLRVINVADGTNEILRRTIAQRLLAGDTDL
ncbi:acyl-CoA dehydrogenase family protein [Reyranella sp. CPCC 100927]|uniref:acyl-CoA dehydrogenase family protein n=1 Tax=Reyranella sp. CPCC 100927 TaxID=2599616 RepID=UPI0011B458E6|nr:acyl-CoA dehydrogenase [Reyranella sp. CPCC 100927]TWT11450.1 acyl-CoA dehydrogenase [Reyranella sp. CPCC 100927]